MIEATSSPTARFSSLEAALNNAVIIPPLAPVHELELADWNRTLAVNLTGPMLCLKHTIRAMLGHARGGAIVNLASAASLIAYPGKAGLRFQQKNAVWPV